MHVLRPGLVMSLIGAVGVVAAACWIRTAPPVPATPGTCAAPPGRAGSGAGSTNRSSIMQLFTTTSGTRTVDSTGPVGSLLTATFALG